MKIQLELENMGVSQKCQQLWAKESYQDPWDGMKITEAFREE